MYLEFVGKLPTIKQLDDDVPLSVLLVNPVELVEVVLVERPEDCDFVHDRLGSGFGGLHHVVALYGHSEVAFEAQGQMNRGEAPFSNFHGFLEEVFEAEAVNPL